MMEFLNDLSDGIMLDSGSVDSSLLVLLLLVLNHTLGFVFVDDVTLSAADYVTLTASINTWMTSLTQARRP